MTGNAETFEPSDEYEIVFNDEPGLTMPEAIADWVGLVEEAMEQIDNGDAEAALTPLADLKERMTERLQQINGEEHAG